MLFDSLKDKFDILAPLDSSVMIPAPMPRLYVIANKNSQSHFSLHIAAKNLQAVFDAYNCPLPGIISSIVDNDDFLLIDLNTIQTENIKFYMRLNSHEKMISRFPLAIPNTISTADKHLTGISFLIADNSVSQYKYYWLADRNEVFVHRFDSSGNFIEENVETSTHNLTSQEIIDFDDRLEDINFVNCNISKSTRTTGNQSYLGIIEGDDVFRTGGNTGSPVVEHQPIDP
jgi:hypothetical protein